jgi:hypothetical protein
MGYKNPPPFPTASPGSRGPSVSDRWMLLRPCHRIFPRWARIQNSFRSYRRYSCINRLEAPRYLLASALQRLIALHAGVPGLDVATAAALRKIGTKAVAPAMAQLLESGDPQAQLAAASFFGTYSLLADANGDFPDSGPVGTFTTAETKQFTFRTNSALTPILFTLRDRYTRLQTRLLYPEQTRLKPRVPQQTSTLSDQYWGLRPLCTRSSGSSGGR